MNRKETRRCSDVLLNSAIGRLNFGHRNMAFFSHDARRFSAHSFRRLSCKFAVILSSCATDLFFSAHGKPRPVALTCAGKGTISKEGAHYAFSRSHLVPSFLLPPLLPLLSIILHVKPYLLESIVDI